MNKTSKSLEYKQSVLIIDALNEPSAIVVARETKIAHILHICFINKKMCGHLIRNSIIYCLYFDGKIVFFLSNIKDVCRQST